MLQTFVTEWLRPSRERYTLKRVLGYTCKFEFHSFGDIWMLSRNFSRLYLKPMALVVTLAVSVSSHGSSLLDTNGKPLPDDFSALIQLLNESDNKKTKVLGLSTEKLK